LASGNIGAGLTAAQSIGSIRPSFLAWSATPEPSSNNVALVWPLSTSARSLPSEPGLSRTTLMPVLALSGSM